MTETPHDDPRDRQLDEPLRCNLTRIRERIAAACARAGRSPDTVSLLPATKYADIEVMRALVRIGLRTFGENQVKAAEEKAAALPPDITFRLIGHLQRNKAKRALALFSSIESLDSRRLAEELSRRRAGQSAFPVLLEVNTGEEPGKHGFRPAEVVSALEIISALPGLRVEGLMTVPPYLPDPESVRPYFRALRQLRDEARQRGLGDGRLDTLSMGMSGDFEVAVEEGATVVRIGSALFRTAPQRV